MYPNFHTPVSARTRSRLSVEPAPSQPLASTSRSRIPTATRASKRLRRPPLPVQGEEQLGLGEEGQVGEKRKASDEDGRRKKRRSDGDLPPAPEQSQPVLSPLSTIDDTAGRQEPLPAPSTPPSEPPALSKTPSRRRSLTAGRTSTPGKSPKSPNRPPTPARLLLRADPDDDARMAKVQPRPPTPPRSAPRVGATGFSFATPKRPRSPYPDGRLTAPRLLGATAANVRPTFQTTLSSYFTPQPQRQTVLSGAPATSMAGRTIRPLPRSRPPQPPLAFKSQLPVARHPKTPGPTQSIAHLPKTPGPAQPIPHPPKTPRVTVPVPFGGRVGDSTHASLMKSTTKRTEATKAMEKVEAPPAAPVFAPIQEQEESMSVDKDASEPPIPTQAPTTKPATIAPLARPAPPSQLGPPRRPSTRPANHPSTSESSAGPPITRRAPSYPSSLGSGPLTRPSNRIVSNPIPASRPTTRSATAMDVDSPDSSESSTPSSVPTSEPAPSPDAPPSSKRESLSMPSRREGYDAMAGNLSVLNAALAKLRLPAASTSTRATDTVRPPRPSARPPTPALSEIATPPAPVLPGTVRPRNLSSRQPLASVGVNIARSRTFLTDEAKADLKGRSIESLLTASKSKLFKGVVAFVDVRNEDGSDVGSSFVEMLRNAGARVLTRPTESCTHIVYKGGKPSTAAFWRRLDEDRRPHVVGLRWVVTSLKTGQRENEDEYHVDFASEEIFQKRTKSMVPKTLQPQPQIQPIPRSSLSAIPEAPSYRRPFAPKIPSPLKMYHDDDDTGDAPK